MHVAVGLDVRRISHAKIRQYFLQSLLMILDPIPAITKGR